MMNFALVFNSVVLRVLYAIHALRQSSRPVPAARALKGNHVEQLHRVTRMPVQYGNLQANAPTKANHKPLRVVRVVEDGQRDSVGRMVISGRMKDVCAELDRMAACEAAMS
jgi:hypothetical protein